MSRPRPEPVQVVKERRDAALRALASGIPYVQFLNITFERHGDELTSVLNFEESHIGNPALPAIHGGVIASFLETTALVELGWQNLWEAIESGRLKASELTPETLPRMPKTSAVTRSVRTSNPMLAGMAIVRRTL